MSQIQKMFLKNEKRCCIIKMLKIFTRHGGERTDNERI